MNIYIAMPNDKRTDTFVTPRTLAMLQKVGNVSRNVLDRNLSEEEIVKQAKDADIILCGWGTVKYTKDLVKKLPNLKIIAYVAGSMTSTVEAEALTDGVVALTGNYIFAQSVAEGCLCYILCALRQIEKYMSCVRAGGWSSPFFENKGLFGKKVGLIGFGEIAKCFVKLLHPFDVEILVHSGHLKQEDAEAYGVKLASKEEIFSECDIISLHLAMNEKNRGCIDRRLLEMMKQDALLVNTARGGVMDYVALEELLEQKRIWAALDVFDPEPPAPDSKLRTLENTVLMPHMGGPTIDMREYIVESFVKDFEAYKNNKTMKNIFDPTDLSHMTVHSSVKK